jgi:predicted Mrr-cat superfamily restriction endonuclease
MWTFVDGLQGIKKGDIVLCPDGSGQYRVGEVSGDYCYEPGKILFHRRPVHWVECQRRLRTWSLSPKA